MIKISLCICILHLINAYSCHEIDINVNITQLFVCKISPEMLNWNEKERGDHFHATVTSMDGPDIPPWLHVKYTEKNNNLYIFGAAPKDLSVELLELQITITSLNSYRIKSFKLKIWFNFLDEYAKYEVHLRIRNLDIEQMLDKNRQNNLIDIFEENFWTASKGKLYITFMAASDNEGYQLPLNPSDTAGILVHLGSATNFSEELFNLQNETMPLAKHCPSFYKRITVERFFRPKNFIIDWCSFRLVTLSECEQTSAAVAANDCNLLNRNIGNSTLRTDAEFLISKEELPQVPKYGLTTLSVIIPSMFFAVIFTVWLSSFMCFNNEKLHDPSSDDYFETIFFICEDTIRKKQEVKEPEYQDDDAESEILFHF